MTTNRTSPIRITKKELAARLAAVPLFAQCTKRDLRAVARHLELLTSIEGRAIVTEGEAGDAFYLVLDGELVVATRGADTARLGPGQWFGELSLLDPAPRSATVTAACPVVLGVLSVRMFRVLLREYPEISGALLASLAAQLREARR